MATDLSVVHDEHSQAPAPRDRGYLSTQDVLARVTRILEIQKSVMKEGTHFGKIPGTPKPTLYKAGAEKLLTTFQIAAVVKDVIDLSTPDEARYRVRVEGVSQGAGVVLGEAWGECSSNEEKYRWRRPVCPQEFDEAPADLRRIVWKRYQGKPEKQQQVRTSPPDVANTILQMATKRALVPMTRLVLACSDIFDQDLEDMPEELRESMLEQGDAKPEIQPPQRKSEQPTGQTNGKASEPASTLPAGAVLVTKTDSISGEKDGRKWVLFTVWFSDGRLAGTFDQQIATVADMARHDKRPMWPILVEGNKPGKFKLAGFEPSKEKAAAPAAEKPVDKPAEPPASDGLTAEDIPWS